MCYGAGLSSRFDWLTMSQSLPDHTSLFAPSIPASWTDMQTVPYITPQHHANLCASLPRIWTSGLLLLAALAAA